ncbi:MAG TPA: peptidoglycan-binding domain-containing protein [Chthoniobacterales bacterium]|nr:peptidoglycan-binding domain-containing protein [Chthoniobacterales bacterium]
MSRILACLLLFVIAAPGTVLADDTVRHVQEELRKRNLYFGNIDGQSTPEVISSLKRYQKRKGFAVTGTIDADTAASLHVPLTASSLQAQPTADLSQVQSSTAAVTDKEPPVLDLPAEPEPPAESPAPSQDISQDRVNQFVETYLRDGETNDVFLQAWFYQYPVQYFHYGLKDQKFVVQDIRYHVKDWPERKYTLLAPPTFVASGKEGEITVEFSIAYNRRDKKRSASGKAKYTWTVRAEGDDLRIVSISEELLNK